MTTTQTELDDPDRELLAKIVKALYFYDQGDPLKDFIGDDDLIEGLRLLVRVVPDGDRTEAETSLREYYKQCYGEEMP